MRNITVLSLGGSIISPDQVDVEFVRSFASAVSGYLEGDSNRSLIIVTGGGAPARLYQNAYKKITKEPIADLLDEIGYCGNKT